MRYDPESKEAAWRIDRDWIRIAVYGSLIVYHVGMSAAAEATIIITAAVVNCVVSYEMVERVSWLRPLFGLKTQKLPT